MKFLPPVIPVPMLLLIASVANAAVTSFDDIQFWTGEGTNRAALVIDWNGEHNADTALVWGYRWDGTATGEHMLREILAADNRLFSKISASGPSGIAIYGFGYDENDDATFELDDNTNFDSDGIAVTDPSAGAEAIDPVDRYSEGWSLGGFWHYGLANGGPTGWISSGGGASGRILSDGDWDSHAFTPSYDFNTFAENLVAALPDSLPGDFNNDGSVDAADYTVWRDGLGTTYLQEDYAIWQSNYGNSTSFPTSSSQAETIPEPATAALLLFFLVMRLSIVWPAVARTHSLKN